MLANKKILLGVCGSIAAYKAAMLVRLLVKQGADVKVIITKDAKEFITPLTLSTLSKNPVLSEFVANEAGEWNNHVELGLWADAMVIAPASANTIAKMANGMCDNLLLATYLSAKCPVYVAPAMDLDMYQHPSTPKNLTTLKGYGNKVIDAEHGELASGLVGMGRMAEPEHIVEFLDANLGYTSKFKGKKVLVTAGPTYENIDPVRFIGNYSTGKMGFAIAEAFAEIGAEVTLVAGPVSVDTTHPNIKRINITSASQMQKEVETHFKATDICVMSAAVADYKPAKVEKQKIKKAGEALKLDLVKNPDILYELGKQKSKKQLLVGFALETSNEIKNAKAKLEAKNLDLMVLNSLNDKGAGFGHGTNKVTLIDKKGIMQEGTLKLKKEIAKDIILKLESLV